MGCGIIFHDIAVHHSHAPIALHLQEVQFQVWLRAWFNPAREVEVWHVVLNNMKSLVENIVDEDISRHGFTRGRLVRHLNKTIVTYVSRLYKLTWNFTKLDTSRFIPYK